MFEWVISTSLLIVIVMVLRQLLKDRIRPWVRYALWLVVLARLLVPFQFGEFDYSMMNAVEQLPMVQEIDSMRNVDQIAHMEDGSRVELYDFDYALLTDDVERIMWAGGMYLDSQCRLHGFNGGGQFAVRYRGEKVTATAFMGNDFWVSSADFENKEAQEWIKERLKNALDQAE